MVSWWKENWELGVPEWKKKKKKKKKGKVDYDTWLNDAYGIQRLEGILNFMDSEDWSVRLPEMQEFLNFM